MVKINFWQIFILISLVLFFGCIGSGDKVIGTAEFQGTLEQRSWEKTAESYCAGGSDYFVLTTSEGETKVLKFSDKLYSFVGQNVKISVNEIERTIQCDPNTQCLGPKNPKTGTWDYSCTLFEVIEITPIP